MAEGGAHIQIGLAVLPGSLLARRGTTHANRSCRQRHRPLEMLFQMLLDRRIVAQGADLRGIQRDLSPSGHRPAQGRAERHHDSPLLLPWVAALREFLAIKARRCRRPPGRYEMSAGRVKLHLSHEHVGVEVPIDRRHPGRCYRLRGHGVKQLVVQAQRQALERRTSREPHLVDLPLLIERPQAGDLRACSGSVARHFHHDPMQSLFANQACTQLHHLDEVVACLQQSDAGSCDHQRVALVHAHQ